MTLLLCQRVIEYGFHNFFTPPLVLTSLKVIKTTRLYINEIRGVAGSMVAFRPYYEL